MEIVVVILMLVLGAPLAFALWLVLKLRSLQEDAEALRRSVERDVRTELAGLSERLDALEANRRVSRPSLDEDIEEETRPTPATAPGHEEEKEAIGVDDEEPSEAPERPASAPVTAPIPAPPESSGADLEELIGGPWLNRLGVLITVIGMALGLGYSFQYLGPAGRVATSAVLALAMLGAGILLERRDLYRTYGRGLIGGGWAALYVTTYAAHGVDAARVVSDPTFAAALLMAVAFGMLLHSLRYQSEVVTGTAFLVAFATLAITDLSTFAVVASIPLAAALLFVAHRFCWGGLAALGVVATYGTYLLSEASLPQTGSPLRDFLAGQAILLGYWLLFEGFDLSRLEGWLETEADAGRRDPAAAVAPLNAAGFVGISLLQWSARAPEMVGWFASLATLLYVASALLRTRLRPLDADAGAGELATSGGYPVPLAIAAGMGALALAERYSGLGLTLAWALEAEFLFLAGLYLRQPFLRGLAAVAFLLPWLQLLGDDITSNARVAVAGLELREWTPLAIVMAATAYLDRFLLHRRRPMAIELFYSWVASWTLLIVVAAELPNATMELGWLVLAAALFVAGRAAGLLELRGQAYGLASVAFLSLLALKILGMDSGPPRPWVSLAPATALAYAAAFYFGRQQEQLGERERTWARNLSAAAGGILAVGFLGHALPDSLVTAGWAILGTTLVIAGFALRERLLRFSGLALLALCVAKVFLWDLSELEPPYRILSFLVLGLLLLGGSLFYTRSRERLTR